uniref:Interferon beta n=1 Tax=Moschus moschiferus TaxID=68415 RepID=A0A8C6CJ10_MOSMO
MTYRCLLQMALLLCFSTTALSSSYSLRSSQSRDRTQVYRIGGRLSIVSCLRDRTDFRFPQTLMKRAQQFRKEDAVLVMYEVLQQIFGILTRDFSSTGWSETIVEDLLVELYGQMNRLEPIQKEIMQKKNFTMGDTAVLHLKKYYFSLVQYLKSKEYNRCAWTVVRVQILMNFSFLKSLTGYLRD